MKLYFKQKFLTLRQRSDITDEYGNVMFKTVGEISIGRRMHIYDNNDNELAFIKQRLFRLMPRFSVYVGGNYVADIVRNFTVFSQDYRIEGLGWTIKGDWHAHDYTITSGGRYIASIHKKWMSVTDSFEIDIADGEDYVMVLAVIIAIDCVIDNAQAR